MAGETRLYKARAELLGWGLGGGFELGDLFFDEVGVGAGGQVLGCDAQMFKGAGQVLFVRQNHGVKLLGVGLGVVWIGGDCFFDAVFGGVGLVELHVGDGVVVEEARRAGGIELQFFVGVIENVLPF